MQSPNHLLTTLMPFAHQVEFLLTGLHTLEGTLVLTDISGGGHAAQTWHRVETLGESTVLSSFIMVLVVQLQ